jgi:hypothetical protein
MNVKLLFLLITLYLLGSLAKIYDDLNDNNLFDYFYLSKEKEYINHFLIGFQYIFLTTVTLNYPIVFFSIAGVVLPQIIMDRKAFDNPFEFNVVVLFFLLALYLLFCDNVFVKMYKFVESIFNHEHIYFLFFYVILWYLMYFFDISQFKNIEFGYKKLLIRFFLSSVLFSALVINYINKIVPNEWLYFFIYFIGYLSTSCIFQVILLYKKNKFSVCFKNTKVEKKQKKNKSKLQQINCCN